VLLRDVPWAIPLQDINSALAKQGIVAGNVERSRQFVRVEVKCLFSILISLITLSLLCGYKYTNLKQGNDHFLPNI